MKEKTAECVNLPITINKRATISISSKDGIIASTGKIEKKKDCGEKRLG